MKKEIRITLVFLVVTLLLVGCVPETMANAVDTVGSSLRYVRVETYNQSMAYWRNAAFWVPFMLFIGVMIAGIAIAYFFSLENGSSVFIAIAAVFLVIASYSSFASWKNIVTRAPVEVAKAADDNGINGLKFKKQEVSFRYLELVNYLFPELLPNESTDLTIDSEVVKTCKGRLDARTNCYPFEHVYYSYSTWHCGSYDDKGNCEYQVEDEHYQHDPDVEFLIRYGAVSNLPDKYATSETSLVVRAAVPDRPIMLFSDWMLPMDYEDHWFSDRAIRKHHDYVYTDYTPPSEWSFYQELQTRGGSSKHRYSNPLLATANEDFVGDPALISRLEAAGMLLEPRELFSPTGGNVKTYFDFVYPLGACVKTLPVDWAGMTKNAGIVNTYYGNALHISNSFAFVCETDLQQQGITLDDLVFNIKADLYNEGKWQSQIDGQTLYTIMQQNTILTVCAVSQDTHIAPNNCRAMSGLPIGNEGLKQAFLSGLPAELQNMTLSPEGFFGDPQVVSMPDNTLSIIGTEGHPMYLWQVYGARKPSMDENFGYLVDRIVLTNDQIQEVIDEGVAKQHAVVMKLYLLPWIIFGLEFFLLILAMAGVLEN